MADDHDLCESRMLTFVQDGHLDKLATPGVHSLGFDQA